MSKRRLVLAAAGLGAAGVAGWLGRPVGFSFSGVLVPDVGRSERADLTQTLLAVALSAMGEREPAALAWNWGEGVLLLGLQRAAAWTRDPRLDEYVARYYSHHLERGVEVSWSDDTTPAIALTERALLARAAAPKLAAQVVEYVMSAPRSQRQSMLLHLGNTRVPLIKDLLPEIWVDSVFHVVPTLLRYSELTSDPRYSEEGVRQLLLFVKNLQDPQTGLITHGYNDRAGDDEDAHVPPFSMGQFWARGNGWMLATLVDALRVLPLYHVQRLPLLAATTRLLRALQRVRHPSGLFHTLLLQPETYLESAGSALIIYGINVAAELGLLPDEPEARLVDKNALLRMLKHEGGRSVVAGTSLGTNPVPSLYALTPTADQVSYGVGAWLMAAVELLRRGRS